VFRDKSRSVHFGFASLEEIAPNGTVVQYASLQDGLATLAPPLFFLSSFILTEPSPHRRLDGEQYHQW